MGGAGASATSGYDYYYFKVTETVAFVTTAPFSIRLLFISLMIAILVPVILYLWQRRCEEAVYHEEGEGAWQLIDEYDNTSDYAGARAASVDTSGLESDTRQGRTQMRQQEERPSETADGSEAGQHHARQRRAHFTPGRGDADRGTAESPRSQTSEETGGQTAARAGRPREVERIYPRPARAGETAPRLAESIQFDASGSLSRAQIMMKARFLTERRDDLREELRRRGLSTTRASRASRLRWCAQCRRPGR